MKKLICRVILFSMLLLCGCSGSKDASQIVATTRPVYDFSTYLCENTGLKVNRLITESVSCLHDYSLQVSQMRALETAQIVVISGAGLEDFLGDIIGNGAMVIDASSGISLLCREHEHEHDDHHHEHDPHIWLDVNNARIMAQNICQGLKLQYPEYADTFDSNMEKLDQEFDALNKHCKSALANLSSRDLITFHDGFSYFAQYCDLNLLRAIEEESGSEASAAELKDIIQLVKAQAVPAIFTEENGSTAASQVISAEAGIPSYALNMGMSDKDYFEAMYHNIDTIREAME